MSLNLDWSHETRTTGALKSQRTSFFPQKSSVFTGNRGTQEASHVFMDDNQDFFSLKKERKQTFYFVHKFTCGILTYILFFIIKDQPTVLTQTK